MGNHGPYSDFGSETGMVREIALSGDRQETFTLPSYDT